MRYFAKCVLSLLAVVCVLPIHAQDAAKPKIKSVNEVTSNGSRGNWGSSPMEILDNVHGEANRENPIQDTALDTVSHTDGAYDSTYRLTNTFDSIRKKIAPYIDWMLYIGLSAAVILLIRQGLQLVTGKTFSDIRKPLMNILSGTAILVGVYVIIRLVTGIIATIFNI